MISPDHGPDAALTKRIFLGSWQCLAHESQIAAPGDYAAETIAGATPGVTLDDSFAIACNPGAIRAVRGQGYVLAAPVDVLE